MELNQFGVFCFGFCVAAVVWGFWPAVFGILFLLLVDFWLFYERYVVKREKREKPD